MAFVRTRPKGEGSVSTALVEAHRDEKGRPRQRSLANLHGEPDLLSALAKLAVRRDDLRKEKDAMAADAVQADKFYEIVTLNSLLGKQYNAEQRKEIDTLLRQRDHLLARMAKIEADLATIQKDGLVIKNHCSATPEQIQAAIKAYKKKRDDAEALVVGMECALQIQLTEAKATLRRLQSI
jgi:chromosome segregation ATPase